MHDVELGQKEVGTGKGSRVTGLQMRARLMPFLRGRPLEHLQATPTRLQSLINGFVAPKKKGKGGRGKSGEGANSDEEAGGDDDVAE